MKRLPNYPSATSGVLIGIAIAFLLYIVVIWFE